MATDSTFKRLPANASAEVTIWVEDQPLKVLAGESVAAAVLAAGLGPTRTTPVSGSQRAPYCMMGVCFECLMEIDGQPNTQGCMTPVAEGMQVRFQLGARRVPEDGGPKVNAVEVTVAKSDSSIDEATQSTAPEVEQHG